MIGQTISHYKILSKLGEGGMGVVYKAHDTKLDRDVALKFLPRDLSPSEEERSRFIQEAKAASALDHNNICAIHEIGETIDNQLFITMSCYEGETLKKKLEQGPLKIGNVIEIALQVAQGLSKAHEKVIIHRDIKPANIFITTDNIIKILDFGLAKLRGMSKLTKTGSTVGTAPYMSPEQTKGELVDHRTDIWSLGIVLFEMITGQLPFKGDYEQAITYQIVNAELEPVTGLRSGVPIELERIANKCLEKTPNERYQHADDLIADLKRLQRTTSQSVPSATQKADKPTPKKKQWAVIAVLLVIVIGFVLIFKPFTENSERNIKSIAVLPFKNMSDSKDDEFFSDGITEDIITQLAKIGELKVIARTSVMRYKNTTKSIKAIGSELNVATVLEGSVRRAGNQVRIVAQLIDVNGEVHLWAETYDKELTQIFAIQSDVAQRIAKALKATLSQEVKERIERKPTENTEAYQLCLRGRFYWNKRTGDAFKKAIEFYNQAIEKEPKYALAYAGLASIYVLYPGYAGGTIKEYGPKAKAAANKAIELDSTLAEPYAVRGRIKLAEGDLEGGKQEFIRAIDLDPSYATAHLWYSVYFSAQERWAEEIAEMLRALDLDPLSLIINASLGDSYRHAKQYNKAIIQYRKTLELDPNFPGAYVGLGWLYLQLADYKRAEQCINRALTLDTVRAPLHNQQRLFYYYQGNYDKMLEASEKLRASDTTSTVYLRYVAMGHLLKRDYRKARVYFLQINRIDSTLGSYELGYIAIKSGDSATARNWFKRGFTLEMKKIEEGDSTGRSQLAIAFYYALIDQKSTACEWLQKAIDKGWKDYRYALSDPKMENLRTDERFKSMMAKLKAEVDSTRQSVEKIESEENQ